MALSSLRDIAICSGSLAAALAFGSALFVWSGLYDVGASDPHYAVTRWLLEFAKRRSIETQSLFVNSPVADDPDLVALGASHYDIGCAPCHGAPGRPSSPIVQKMLPAPADLLQAAPTWSAAQLYWIVKNGLKFTGMPAWPAQEREDEIRAVVALLRAMPTMDPAKYKRLAVGGADDPMPNGPGLAELDSDPAKKCARCHREGETSQNRLVPRLAGQSQAYIEMSLRDYAKGLRRSGIMQPIAAALDEGGIAKAAQYYARLPRAASVSTADAEQIARGRTIAMRGVPEAGVPACLACHSGKSAAAFPTLDGQHAPYIVGQLQLLRRGVRDQSVYGKIMSVIAPRLTDPQIADVAAYFASVSPPLAQPSSARPRPRRK